MAINILNLLGSYISITRLIRFGNINLQAILSALSKSKAIINKYINTLDTAKLTN